MADKRFVAKNGLDNNTQTITNVADPVNAQDAATKSFASNADNLTSGSVSADRIAATTVTGKALTGYSVGSNTALSATDTILEAFQKVQGQINAAGGGTKTFAVFTPMTNQPPASNFATLDTRNSVATLDFDAATAESAVWAGVVAEGAVLTSGIKVTIFWAATSATSGDVVWSAQLEKTNGHDIDADGFDTATTATTTTSGTSGVVNVTTITCTSIDSLAAGDMFRLKVTRDAANGSDTMTGDAELVAVEVEAA